MESNPLIQLSNKELVAFKHNGLATNGYYERKRLFGRPMENKKSTGKFGVKLYCSFDNLKSFIKIKIF